MLSLLPAALSLAVVSTSPASSAPAQESAPAQHAAPDAARTEAAVIAGLDWLTRQQEPDGHWSAVATFARCPAGAAKGLKLHDEYDVGLTGLAVLGLSRARAKLGDRASIAVDQALGRGVDWLVAQQKGDGSFGASRAFMYNEAIATRALVAAAQNQHDVKARAAAQKAVSFVQAAQRPSPTGKGAWGWRYAARQAIEAQGHDDSMLRELYDSDTSVTAWCADALRAARDAGLDVDSAALQGALDFVRFVTTQDGSVGYLDPKAAGATVTGVNDHYKYHPAVMSALGTLVRLDAGESREDKVVGRCVERVLADPPAVSDDHLWIDYYYWHHGLAALHRTRAANAETWTNLAVAHLVDLQENRAGECSQGAWIVPDRWSYAGGWLYTTGLNVLTLEDALDWD